MSIDDEALARLRRNENRYLSGFVCGWCDMPLNREGCGAIYQKCSDETRNSRRAKCLAEYKPRALRIVPCTGGGE